MIRFILHLAIVNILSYTAYSGGMIWKALKGLDKEYEGNESWYNGKKEAIQTLIICITCLIIISCIIR